MPMTCYAMLSLRLRSFHRRSGPLDHTASLLDEHHFGDYGVMVPNRVTMATSRARQTPVSPTRVSMERMATWIVTRGRHPVMARLRTRPALTDICWSSRLGSHRSRRTLRLAGSFCSNGIECELHSAREKHGSTTCAIATHKPTASSTQPIKTTHSGLVRLESCRVIPSSHHLRRATHGLTSHAPTCQLRSTTLHQARPSAQQGSRSAGVSSHNPRSRSWGASPEKAAPALRQRHRAALATRATEPRATQSTDTFAG